MAELGVNVAGRAEQKPADIAALGATWCRAVAYPDANIRGWMQDCHAYGLKVLLVLAHESIGGNPAGWDSAIAMYRDRYGSLVDAWQVGNESDHVSPSSWTLSQADLSSLLRAARNSLMIGAQIIGPGLVSGQPGWAATVDWTPVNAIACHPYAKWPGTPELSYLIAGYAAYGNPLWVTEYNARTLGMAAALRDDPRLSVALAFCMTDRMVQGFGLLEDPTSLADFKAAAKGGTPVPGDNFSVGDGMRALMAQRGDVPAADELYFHLGQKNEWSECMAASGRLYRYVFSTDTTYSFPPEAA